MAVLGHDEFTKASDTPLENHTPTIAGTSWTDAEDYDITASTDRVSVTISATGNALLSDESSGKITEVRGLIRAIVDTDNDRGNVLAATVSGTDFFGYLVELSWTFSPPRIRLMKLDGTGQSTLESVTPENDLDTGIDYWIVLQLSDDGTDVTLDYQVLDSNEVELASSQYVDTNPGASYIGRNRAGFRLQDSAELSEWKATDDTEEPVGTSLLMLRRRRA